MNYVLIRNRRPRQNSSPRGVTLLELLVVVSVIGVLVALLLPAVQTAREAARRTQCVSNLKQLGLAMHHYHSVHNMFPPSQLFTGTTSAGLYFSKNFISGHVFVLPYLEHSVLYDAINMDFVNIESPAFPSIENRTARNTRVAGFLCPSDGEPLHLNSYRFNRGRFGRWPSGLNYDGPFSIGVMPSDVTIRDGLAHTAFVSERISGSFTGGANDMPRGLKAPSHSVLYESDAQFIPFCLNDMPGEWGNTAGRYWFFNGFANTLYNHNGTPNDKRPSCVLATAMDSAPGGLSPPRSFHMGTVNVLFGDGHVQRVADGMAQPVWIALGTYDGGDN